MMQMDRVAPSSGAPKGPASAGAEAPMPGVAAVDRAFAVLAAFGSGASILSLAQIAGHTGFHKSTILRLIASLERADFMRRLDDGRYAIGPAPLKLAGAYQRGHRLADHVVPVLGRLAAATGETASFYVREGNGRVCLHRVEGDHPVRAVVREGDRLPLGRGAAGRVLPAFAGATGAAHDVVRAQGYAVSVGEITPDVASIAAPVFDVVGKLVGAVNLSGPAHRLAGNAAMIAATRAAAADATRRLGGDADPFNPDAARRPRTAP